MQNISELILYWWTDLATPLGPDILEVQVKINEILQEMPYFFSLIFFIMK